MYAAIESVVSLKDHPVSEISFHPDVCLVALRNAQAETEPTGKAGVKHAKISDERRVDRQRLRKLKIRGNKRPAEVSAAELAGGGINEIVRVEKLLLSAKSE